MQKVHCVIKKISAKTFLLPITEKREQHKNFELEMTLKISVQLKNELHLFYSIKFKYY